MPEGPEVRRLVDQLQESFIGKKVDSIVPISGRYTRTPIVKLKEFNNTQKISSIDYIEDIGCKGKFIWWMFYNVREYLSFSKL